MIKANFNTYASYVTDSLYQWDLNQILRVAGLNLAVVPEVHFSNANMDRAIVRQATMENNVVSVKIPNSLLQDPLTIRAHIGIYEGDTFKIVELVEIPVIPRKRPVDYQIEDSDEEIYSFKVLENRIANIVAAGSNTGNNNELIDIRVGYDETRYPSAGEAVRKQIQKIAENVKTLNNGGLELKDDVIGGHVDAWLDNHPEATTTVQNGALTDEKFSEELKLYAIKDYVTPQMFGAKGDGITDDTDAIQNALAHDIVYIPNGVYLISAPLIMDDTTHLYGGSNTIIKAIENIDCVLMNDSENVAYINQNFSIKNLTLDGNNLAKKGIHLTKISMECYSAVDGLKVINCTEIGVHLFLCQTSAFYNIRVTDCYNGINIEGCNNAKFYNLAACSNTGEYGIKINAIQGGSGGLSVYGVHAEMNSGAGLILNELNSMATILGGWIEENGGHSVYINNSMAYVSGLTITGSGANDNKWLYITGDKTVVENCFRAKSNGDESWLTAHVDGDSIVGNINTFQGIETLTIGAIEDYSDLLDNGNCEDTTGWNGSSTTLTHQSAEVVHSGEYSLKAVGSASGASTYQSITGLKVGNIYHITGYVYSVDVDRLRMYFKYVNNPDNSTNKFYYEIPDEDWDSEKWVPINFYFRAKDTSYDIHVQCTGNGGTYYLDDFSVREYVPTAKAVQSIGNVNNYVYQIPKLADY